MKHSVEYRKFDSLVELLLDVSHEEMQRREAEWAIYWMIWIIDNHRVVLR